MNYSNFFLIIVFLSCVSCFASKTDTQQLRSTPETTSQVSSITTSEACVGLLAAGSLTFLHYSLIEALLMLKRLRFAIAPTPCHVNMLLILSGLGGFSWYQFAQYIREKSPNLGNKAYLAASLPTILALILAIPHKNKQSQFGQELSSSV